MRLVVEVARFILDCLQLVLATESADMVLVFSLLHTTNTALTHNDSSSTNRACFQHLQRHRTRQEHMSPQLHQ